MESEPLRLPEVGISESITSKLRSNSPSSSRPPSSISLNSSSTSTTRSSPSKSPCTQCIILHQRMKSQLNQQFGGNFVGFGNSQSPTTQIPTPTKILKISPKKTSTSQSSQTPSADCPVKRNLNYEFISDNLVNRKHHQTQQSTTTTRTTSISGNLNETESAVPLISITSIDWVVFVVQLLFSVKSRLFCPNRLLPRSKMLFRIGFIFCLYLATLVTISVFVIYRFQPKPFIDEIFHIPQATEYLRGNFSYWDQKITTPPGLYLISTGILRPLLWLIGDSCLVHLPLLLRLTNCLFTTGNWALIYYLLPLSNNNNSNGNSSTNWSSIISSLSLSLFPPLFFFSFLYYTDPGSMFFLLLTSYFALARNRVWIASIFGAISLLFRQTNIVWIFLLAFNSILELVRRQLDDVYRYRLMNFFIFGSTKVVFSFDPSQCKLSNPKYLSLVLFDLGCKVVQQLGGFLLNGLCFLVFIYWNNGIVLGDRTAHQAVLHLAQLPYLLLFFSVFGAGHIFTSQNLSQFVSTVRSRPLVILCTAGFLCLSLTEPFRYIHPYLLADNRHYSFYLWRRLLSPVNIRFGLVPVYLFSLVSIWNSIRFSWSKSHTTNFNARRSPHWLTDYRMDQLLRSAFWFCTIITVVPQKLLELRYFIVPFLLWRILASRSTPKISTPSTMFEMISFVLINLVTIWIFVSKTFVHPADPDPNQLQRIIW